MTTREQGQTPTPTPETDEAFIKFNAAGGNTAFLRMAVHAQKLERERDRMREAAITMSDALHFYEISHGPDWRVPSELDAAWLKLSVAIEETSAPASVKEG